MRNANVILDQSIASKESVFKQLRFNCTYRITPPRATNASISPHSTALAHLPALELSKLQRCDCEASRSSFHRVLKGLHR